MWPPDRGGSLPPNPSRGRGQTGAPRGDLTSWDGTLKIVRQLHGGRRRNQGRLLAGLDARGAYEFLPQSPKLPTPPTPAAAEGEQAKAAGETIRPAWLALTEIERVKFSNSMVERATGRSVDDAVALWQPYDGRVEDLDEMKCAPL